MAKVVRKLVSNVVKQIRRNLVYDLVQRHFTTLQAAFGQYYSIAPVTLSGDFEIEFSAYIDSSQTTSYIYGNTLLGFYSRIAINPDGKISIRTQENGSALDIPAGTYTPYLNKLTRSKLIKNGTSLSFYANDTLLGSSTINSSDTLFIEFFGRNSAAYFPAKIISDFKIKSSGTLIHSWALDSDGSTSTEIDTVGGNNATRVNLTAADTELFTKDGADWVGEELSAISSATNPPDITENGFDYWYVANVVISNRYRISAIITENINSASTGWSGISGIQGSPPFRKTDGSTGFVGGDYTASTTIKNRVFNVDTGLSSFSNISCKRLIEVA